MEKKKIILFQGDSITDGARGRSEDPNHILGHSYAYIVAAKLGYENCEKNFEFINRGISGDTSTDLYARWQRETLNLKPDYISILIGTNDISQEVQAPQDVFCDRFSVTLELILKQTKEVLPNTKFILMEPFMLNTGNFESDYWERTVQVLKSKQLAIKMLAKEFNCVYVHLQNKFDEAAEKQPNSYWIWDSVHPTYAGHGLIAQAWLTAVKEIF